MDRCQVLQRYTLRLQKNHNIALEGFLTEIISIKIYVVACFLKLNVILMKVIFSATILIGLCQNFHQNL